MQAGFNEVSAFERGLEYVLSAVPDASEPAAMQDFVQNNLNADNLIIFVGIMERYEGTASEAAIKEGLAIRLIDELEEEFYKTEALFAAVGKKAPALVDEILKRRAALYAAPDAPQNAPWRSLLGLMSAARACEIEPSRYMDIPAVTANLDALSRRDPLEAGLYGAFIRALSFYEPAAMRELGIAGLTATIDHFMDRAKGSGDATLRERVAYAVTELNEGTIHSPACRAAMRGVPVNPWRGVRKVLQ